MAKGIPLPVNYIETSIGSDGRTTRCFRCGDLSRKETYPDFAFKDGIDYTIEPTSISISRLDLGLGFIKNPRLYGPKFKKIKLPKDFERCDTALDYDWKAVGEENIDGKLCTKFELYQQGAEHFSEILYMDIETKMRVRTTTYNLFRESCLTMDTVDIHMGEPDLKYFEVPKK